MKDYSRSEADCSCLPTPMMPLGIGRQSQESKKIVRTGTVDLEHKIPKIYNSH